jgi:hypothetical protein
MPTLADDSKSEAEVGKVAEVSGEHRHVGATTSATLLHIRGRNMAPKAADSANMATIECV